MPAKNAVKIYADNSFYHIYNRGVEKRTIFKNAQDYKVFLSYLKEYLSPPPDPKATLKNFSLQGRTFKGVPHQPKNYHQKIQLIAYCLMPNHFHLLIKQQPADAIKQFMQSFLVRYTIYFNQKYKRVGSLFQGKYKAVLVTEEPYLLHLSRYIHLNPQKHFVKLVDAYSSYADFLRLRNTAWVHPQIILSFFHPANLPLTKNINTYQQFVEELQLNSQDFLGNFTLES